MLQVQFLIYAPNDNANSGCFNNQISQITRKNVRYSQAIMRAGSLFAVFLLLALSQSYVENRYQERLYMIHAGRLNEK
ncbi:hypothetical protein KDH_54310 [Dictyobacter sp. S3.2.2.5]|uniref:Uncharacterized protein n=1 Tax=Dictyobacter halimunensis TaxID=3026934 RepID=A0ABQ6FXR2_9CHLR|nr:hypothetical protein KDH_54310 [Dictyobacter sp. S3.2.2.5]